MSIAALYTHIVVRDPHHPSIERRVPRHVLGLDCQCREHKAEPGARRPNPSFEQRQAMAREAGARGKSAAPMSHHRRIEGYFAQRALTGARRLTTRQQRQLIRREWVAGLAQLGA